MADPVYWVRERHTGSVCLFARTIFLRNSLFLVYMDDSLYTRNATAPAC